MGSSCAVGNGFNSVDGDGNIYVADDGYDLGDGFVAKETLQSPGNYIQSTVLTSASMPYPGGIAVDGRGNLYVTDNFDAVLYRDDLADPPSLSFATTPYGSTSSDSPKTISVQNAGNAALTYFAVTYPADFPEQPGNPSDCTSSTSLPAGWTCTLSIDFTPSSQVSQSTLLNEDVSIATNALNANPSTQNVAVSGTETTTGDAIAVPSLVFNPPAGNYTSSALSVAIAASMPRATIYYTTDGTKPTTKSRRYAGAISLTASTTLKAIAVVPGHAASAIASAQYGIKQPDSKGKHKYQMAIVTVGTKGIPQVTLAHSATSIADALSAASGQDNWVQAGMPTFMIGITFYYYDSTNPNDPNNCKLVGTGSLSVQADLLRGTFTPGTGAFVFPAGPCAGYVYTFATMNYTWGQGESQAALLDPFTLGLYDPYNDFLGSVGLNAELAHITMTPAVPSGSGSNPPLTSTATLVNSPGPVIGYTWSIIGGGGAIQFPNGHQTMTVTGTNQIAVTEPSPTGSSVSFQLQVTVEYTLTTTTDNGGVQSPVTYNVAKTYGPVPATFCPPPTITSISPNVWFAGQTYNNVAITGKGFVTDGSSQSCPTSNINVTASDGSYVAVNNVKVVSPTEITASIGPSSSAGGSPPAEGESAPGATGATVTVTGQATQQPNADILGIPIIQWNNSTNTNNTISTPFVNATQSAVVGQQVKLTPLPMANTLLNLPISLTLSTAQPPWNIAQSSNVGGFTPTQTSSSVTSTVLTQNANLTTYWVYPQSGIQVSYQYCVNGGGLTNACSPETAIATFNVTGPQGGSMSFTPFSPAVSIANLAACTGWPAGPYLVYGQGVTGSVCHLSGTSPGITFNNPTGYSNASGGTFSLVQMIGFDSLATPSAGLGTR